LRDELNKWLVPRFGENVYIDFDISALPELQQDLERMSRILRDAYWLTLDEKRSAMNYEERGGIFDAAYVNQSLVPLEQITMDLTVQDGNNGTNGRTNMGDSDGSISEDTNGEDMPNGAEDAD
jgi:hypothetical protein